MKNIDDMTDVEIDTFFNKIYKIYQKIPDIVYKYELKTRNDWIEFLDKKL